MLTTKKGAKAVHIYILFSCVLFLLSGCGEPGPKALLQGERLLKEGKYPEAIARFQEACDLLPQNAQAWNHLGVAYHYSGQVDKAAENYRRAIQVNRNLASARYNLGQLYFEQHQYANATEEFNTFLSFETKNYEAWLKLSTAQMRHAAQLAGPEKIKWLDMAKRNFQYLLQFGQTPQIYNALGVIEVQRGKPRDALQYFNTALQKQSNYAPAILNLAILHHGYLNDRRTALYRYREYLATQPRSTNLREIEAAARQIELELNPPPAVQPTQQFVTNIVTQVLAPAPVATNAVVRPTPQVMQPVVRDPRSPVTQPQAKPSPTPAKETPKVATTPLPPTIVTPTVVPEKAPEPKVSVPEPAPVQVAPETPIVAAQPITVPSTTPPEPTVAPAPTIAPTPTTPEAAASSPQKSTVLQKLNPKSWFGSKTNTPPPAKAQVAVPSPTPKPAASQQVRKDFPRYRYVSPASPRPGNRAEAVRLFNLALQAQRQGDYTGALDLYRQATTADGAFFEAQYNRGLIALEKNSLSEAMAAYETALAISPDSANARYNLGFSLQKANYPVDAAAEFEKIIARNPRETRAHLSLANLYARELGRPTQARAHYLKVLELEPHHPQGTAIRFWLRDNP